MNVTRISASAQELAHPDFPGWQSARTEMFSLVPTPLNGNPKIKAISPFLEKSTDHGTVSALTVSAAHNGDVVAVRLDWASGRHDRVVDLDEFVDGVAVMFPLTAKASAFTMGSESAPVNAWYWKGNLEQTAFDVIATGYGTSERRNEPAHPIACNARHRDGRWQVILHRAMTSADGRIGFLPGTDTAMAFAVWDGGNRERAGRKSFSGDFVRMPIDP